MPRIPKQIDWKKEADYWFSRYIRMRGSFFLGSEPHNRCMSCGQVKRVAELQNGHFASRSHNSTRFDEENCFPQCYVCNIIKKGNYSAFAAAINRLKGAGFTDLLEERSRSFLKYCQADYELMAYDFKRKAAALGDDISQVWRKKPQQLQIKS